MVFAPSGRDHDSTNQYYLSLETPRYLKNITFDEQNILGSFKILKLIFEIVQKGGARNILKIRLIFFENLEYGINIIQKE